MRLSLLTLFIITSSLCIAQGDSLYMPEVVVTGTRNAVDLRHFPHTVNVINRESLTEQRQMNVLPMVMQQVPGLFLTSRSIMGYGVSGGAAGSINIRGITGGQDSY